MAKLKGEFLQQWHDAKGVPLRERLVVASTDMARRLAGPWAPVINAVQGSWLVRQVLQATAGLDARRKAPAFAKDPFPAWFDRHEATDAPEDRTVVLFDDSFMNFYEPDVGISAVEVLEAYGYRVVRANAGCCQRTRISHGFLRDAKTKGTATLRNLAQYAERGWPIICCEPSCAAALTDDLPDLVDDAALLATLDGAIMMIDVFLARELKARRIKGPIRSRASTVLMHGHCNQKALYGTGAMHELLSAAGGVSVSEVDSGCCGMAGSFGYEKEHYDVSMTMGERKLFPAVRRASEDSAVVACGFSCRHQLRDATGVNAKHFIELLRPE